MRFLPGHKGLWERFKNDQTGAICVGCGLDVNGITGLLEVQLAGGDPGSGLHCDNTTGLSTAIQHNASLSGAGNAGSPLAVAISPDNCNAISVRGNGIYAPCTDSSIGTSGVQLSPQSVGLPQLVGGGGSFNYLNSNAFNSIHICNPSCCDAAVVLSIAVSNVYMQASPGLTGGAKLLINVDNGGFVDMDPLPTIKFGNSGSSDTFYAVNLNATYFTGFAPGACHDFQFDLRFEIGTAGASSHISTDSTGPRFLTNWVLSPNDCCDHA